MKHSKFNRFAALAMGTIVTASMLAGCGAPASSASASVAASQPASASSTASNASSDPFAEKVELTIAVKSTPNVEDWENNWQTQEIEKLFNVDLSFVLLPADSNEAKTKLSLMVASGEVLPDIINTGIGNPYELLPVSDYGSKGIFVDLTPYYNDPAKTPNWNKIPKEHQDFIKQCMTSPDGKMYAFPRYEKNLWNEGHYRAWVNHDFMKAAGIEKAPTTTDELYDMLKAFATGDANGNGKKDEVAMVGATSWGQDPVPYLMNSFLYANPEKSYFDLKDGKVVPSFVQPEWKEGLTFINKLINEGLLSPLSFTQDMPQAKSLINVEKGMVGLVTSGSYSMFDKTVVGNPGEGHGYTLLAPVKGPSGKAYTPQNPTTPQFWWEITKDCKNVDRAVAVGDYFLTEMTSLSSQYGEPGVDWSDDPAVMDKYVLPKNAADLGFEKYYANISKLWGVPQSKTWYDANPSYRIVPTDRVEVLVEADSEDGKIEAESGYSTHADYSQTYAPAFRPTEELIVNFAYTEDETNMIADIKTTIDTYVKEQTVAFVTGKRSLDDWDKYLADLEKMGLQQYIDVNQAAYDRF